MATRFVLLRHEMPADLGRPSHWDLLLERDDACWTWALESLPAGLAAGAGPNSAWATRLADHRPHYLDYEGPVSGGRGIVAQTLTGTCEWLEESPPQLRVQLRSEGWECEVVLQPLADDTWQITAQ